MGYLAEAYNNSSLCYYMGNSTQNTLKSKNLLGKTSSEISVSSKHSGPVLKLVFDYNMFNMRIFCIIISSTIVEENSPDEIFLANPSAIIAPNHCDPVLARSWVSFIPYTTFKAVLTMHIFMRTSKSKIGCFVVMKELEI